jgi:hypothetical protein
MWVTDLRIGPIHLRQAPFWHLHPIYCERVHAHDISIVAKPEAGAETTGSTPNVSGSENRPALPAHRAPPSRSSAYLTLPVLARADGWHRPVSAAPAHYRFCVTLQLLFSERCLLCRAETAAKMCSSKTTTTMREMTQSL